jgi:fatty acid desaturase
MLLFIFVAATLVAVYWFWIRPILKCRPAFRELYQEEENFFAALRAKFAGIKQKLSSAVVIAASVIVSGYDFIAPIVSGVDVSAIAAQVPSWAWPLILITVTSVMKYFRDLADKRHEIEVGNGSPAPQEK